MTDRELRKLRRDDLLQILITQQKQIEELTEALEESRRALEDRRIAVEEAGSIAEAALKLNGIFESAQAAADQYLAEVKARADEWAMRSGADEEQADDADGAEGDSERSDGKRRGGFRRRGEGA